MNKELGEKRLDFVTFENRQSDFIAVKLLVLSLQKHAPDAQFHFVLQDPSSSLHSWLRKQPNVIVHNDIGPTAGSYDIKPEILLAFLDKEFERITWIDSDIILCNALPKRLTDLSFDEMLLTQEWLGVRKTGLVSRTVALGLETGENVKNVTINSGIVSVTNKHRDLLKAWQTWLATPAYREAQTRPKSERSIAFKTDQEVLAGLLGSKQYSDTKIQLMRTPDEICQCLFPRTYPPFKRMAHAVFGAPSFVHALGSEKPWREEDRRELEMQIHPYRLFARGYATKLGEHETVWLKDSSPKAKRLESLAFGNACLVGLLHSLQGKGPAPFALLRRSKRWLFG